MNPPTLSVLMPNYNHGRYIAAALRAILEQSWRPSEVIVIDDGSTDESVEVIGLIAAAHPVIKFLRNERNRGLAYTVNRALAEASGDYIYSCSADDAVVPGFFETSMKALSRHPEAGISCGDYRILSGHPEGAVSRDRRLNVCRETIYLPPRRLEELMISREFVIGGQSIVMKRTAMVQAGGFDAQLGWSADWFLDFTVGFRHGICYIPEIMAVARQDADCGSIRHLRMASAQRANLRRMLSLLDSPAYLDVKPLFKSTALLARYKRHALEVLCADGAHRDLLTPLLVGRALRAELLWLLSPVAPVALKDAYHRFRSRRAAFERPAASAVN